MAPIIYQAETDLTLVDDGNNSYEVNPADYIRVKKKEQQGLQPNNLMALMEITTSRSPI